MDEERMTMTMPNPDELQRLISDALEARQAYSVTLGQLTGLTFEEYYKRDDLLEGISKASQAAFYKMALLGSFVADLSQAGKLVIEWHEPTAADALDAMLEEMFSEGDTTE